MTTDAQAMRLGDLYTELAEVLEAEDDLEVATKKLRAIQSEYGYENTLWMLGVIAEDIENAKVSH